MEDQNPRVGDEQMRGRGDERITGREPVADERWAPTSPSPRDYAPAGGDRVEPERRTREIRDEIERTREDMSETVDAIQDRLRPRNIAANAVESVRSRAVDTARDLSYSEPVQYVRSNPIPTAMVGVGLAGLAWLAFGGRSGRRSTGYYEVDDYRGRSRTEQFEHESAGAYTPGMSYDTGRRDLSNRNLGKSWNATTARTRSQVQRTWNDNPLLIGAAAAIAGALVGLAAPETERENRLMGETRDNVIEGVQETVREKVDQVQQVASNAVSQVQNAVGMTGNNEPSAQELPRPGATDLGRS